MAACLAAYSIGFNMGISLAGIKKPQGIERTCGVVDYLVRKIRLCRQEARSTFSWLMRYFG
jgi:hypothetical protein